MLTLLKFVRVLLPHAQSRQAVECSYVFAFRVVQLIYQVFNFKGIKIVRRVSILNRFETLGGLMQIIEIIQECLSERMCGTNW